MTRRRFLSAVPAVAAAAASGTLLRPTGLLAGAGAQAPPAHPDPRPGIDASRVLPPEQLVNHPGAAAIYDGVREIPHIVDGIRCYCGCNGRSLLSCYESSGMATWCEICQGEGKLAHARWKEGQDLEQIRRAIDARYGPDAYRGGGRR